MFIVYIEINDMLNVLNALDWINRIITISGWIKDNDLFSRISFLQLVPVEI